MAKKRFYGRGLMVFNDLHFTRTPPECRGDEYANTLMDILHKLGEIAKYEGLNMACTGDWYHRKGRVSFQETNDLLSILTSWRDKGVETYGILGNHDIATVDSIEMRAVGTLVYSKVLNLLDDGPALLPMEGGTIFLTGTSYFDGNDKNDEARLKAYSYSSAVKPEGSLWVHLAHGVLTNKDSFFGEDFTNAKSLIRLLDNNDSCPDVIVCGHLHNPEGIVRYELKDRPVYICRVGSIGQVSSDDLYRSPHVLKIIPGDENMLTSVPVWDPPTDAPSKDGKSEDGGPKPAKHAERVKEFVRVLRQQADTEATADYSSLIRKVVKSMNFPESIYKKSISYVEKNQ